MEIYLDKEFMQNFFLVRPNENKVWGDFEKEFLKKVRNFRLITNFESQEEMALDEYGSFFLELYADKVKSAEFMGEIPKSEWIIKSLTNSGGYKIFLIEPEDDDIEYLIEMSGYELISTLNLESVWAKYLVKEFKKSIDAPPNQKDTDLFNSWSDLKMVKNSPTNTIIVVDKYILGDKSNQKIIDNLIPLLVNIIPLNYFGLLDILIVSEDIKSNERNRPTEDKVKEIHELLVKYFSKYEFIIRFKILIHNKSFYPNDNMAIHDRIIYTNYFTIESGPGFNLFEGRKRICANSKVEVHFNFQPFYMGVLSRHLEALRKYIEKVKRTEVLKEQFKYYPDAECKLLN